MAEEDRNAAAEASLSSPGFAALVVAEGPCLAAG